MKSHFELSDKEFSHQFANLSLEPGLFTHEAHLRLAWIHIREYGVEQAIENICRQIKKFDKTHGDGTKYHETVTVAAVKMVNHFIQKSNNSNFQDFIHEFSRLKENFKDLLNAHYSFDLFSFEKAVRQYIEPDILPFD